MNKIKFPGSLIKSLCLEPLGLSITETAKALRITRTNLSHILNGKAGITPRMACRLEAVFGTDARAWLELQLDYDLAQARKKRLNLPKLVKGKIKVPKKID